MRQFGEMEKLQQEFAGEVAFLFVYTKEAHPDDGPENRRDAEDTGGWRMKNNAVKIDKHTSYDQRVKAAKDLRDAGKKNWRVLVDDMDSTVQTVFGKLPNSAYLIAPTGRIAGKWAWVSAAPIREKLKAEKSLKPWTIADDPQLPLRSCTEDAWLCYDAGGAKETVTFGKCSATSVTRNSEAIELKAFAGGERAKPVSKTLKVNGVELPCVVITKDKTETWISPWLPGDGVAKIVEDGKVTRLLTDAGFEKDKSILKPYEPEKWKGK
ncbi:hypothetical protein PLCT2_00189 [Planctomycetaceae bacterium]|nr:hypothetical protein PLCT2_00189 [Planctomycetaceae bacterium]